MRAATACAGQPVTRFVQKAGAAASGRYRKVAQNAQAKTAPTHHFEVMDQDIILELLFWLW
jgi:hypothetical protein